MTKYYGTETERVLVEDFGIADTRAMSIRQAMREIHRAVCYLDSHNLKRIWQHYPEIVSVANYYGRNEDGLKTFTQEDLKNG